VTPRPGANWTCYNGGWLPPGMPIPSQSVVPSTPSAPSTIPCTTPRPGSNWTCYNGGWLPPGMPVPSAPPAFVPAPVLPAPSAGGCTTPRPGANWTCLNGGWLPPSHPEVQR